MHVDACNRHMYAEGFVYFNEILDIFKNKNHQIQIIHQAYNCAVLCYCFVYPIVAVEAIKSLGWNPRDHPSGGY